MDSQSRKYFITINNPIDKGYTHDEILKCLLTLSSLRYVCMCDEIGNKTKTYHTHIYTVFENAKRFSTLKNTLPHADIENAKGNNQQNRDYIFKAGKWENTDKQETSIPESKFEWGELPSDKTIPTKETDILQLIQQYLDDDMSPREIYSKGVSFLKYKSIIKQAYFDKRYRETPVERKVEFYYHIGASGSGKSYEHIKLIQQYGDDAIYYMTDYSNGGTAGLDGYCGEPILFMDEFKSNLPYSLLLQLTDKYRADIHCRYNNCTALWTTIHLTSVFPPEKLYSNMVSECDRQIDSITQLLRRITYIVYHRKIGNEYYRLQIPMSEYTSYYELQQQFTKDYLKNSGFEVTKSIPK